MKTGNRLCIVTGGSSGLGLATVKKLVASGALVAVLDLGTINDEIKALEPKAKIFATDVTKSEEISSSLQKILEWSKATHASIAAVVCCAGILGPAKILGKGNKPISMDLFKKVVEVNLFGTIDVISQTLPHMALQEPDENGERGVIVTVASAAAFDGQAGQVAYSATKGAIASIQLPMARDLAEHGIRCVAISPGLFETTMTKGMPTKARMSLEKVLEFPARPGKAEEFADLVSHMISNPMMNGTVVRIDGATRMPSRL